MKAERRKINYLVDIMTTNSGLTMLLTGLMFTLISVLNILVVPILRPFNTAENYYPGDIVFLLSIVLILVGFPLAIWQLGMHQQATLGAVNAARNFRTRFIKIVASLAIVFSVFVGTWVDITYLPGVSVTLATMSAWLILNWLFVGRKAGYVDLILALGIVILALVPSFEVVSGEDFYKAPALGARDYFNSFTLLVWGLVFIFKGLYDHFFIKQMLKPISMEDGNEFV